MLAVQADPWQAQFMETTTNPTATPTHHEATCVRCGGAAVLTLAGWRHGWPPAGHDGHCPGTGLWPTVLTSA